MFDDLLLVAAVAFTAPFLLGLKPGLRLPSVVLEIVAGIVVGPSVLGLVEDDQTLEVIALLGLAFVLFLAGLEIELDKLRGPIVRLAALGVLAATLDGTTTGMLLLAGRPELRGWTLLAVGLTRLAAVHR